MKKLFFILILSSLINAISAQVGINSDNSNPDGSAMLDIKSTDKGILIPRMTSTQRSGISTPATGLLVFQTDGAAGFYFYNGSAWENLGARSTLDGAYDHGGAGAGKEIIADNGAVEVNGEDGFLVTGTHGAGETIPALGEGSRMFFNPNKSAFRAGYVLDNNWDDSNIGEYSVAFGENSLASGKHSVAIGDESIASGIRSFAMGLDAQAMGHTSFAFGWRPRTTGPYSVAIGNYTVAGNAAAAFGYNSESLGDQSLTAGYYNIAEGDNSFAMGWFTKAVGHSSMSMGYKTEAKSYSEAVFGRYNTDYTTANSESHDEWFPTDRLFVIGNGTDENARSNALTMLKNGNTGIGTETPNSKLDVNGTVTATAFSGDGSALTNVSGDNMGTHTATQTLDLNSNDITGAGTITATAFSGDGSALTNVPGDDMGDHTATNNLQLSSNWLTNSGTTSRGILINDNGGVKMYSQDVTAMEVETGNTPTIRLTQDGSKGWQPHTWDIGSNEANFFVRDQTGGAKLPFRIKPNSNQNRITINDDNVGIGLSTSNTFPSATERLDVGGKIRMREGAADGYIPISDANGVMTWTAPNALGSDDQTIDAFSLNGTTINLSLENDGQANQTVDLAPLLGSDDQTVDAFNLSGTTLNLSLENDGQANQTVDLTSLKDNLGNHTATQNIRLNGRYLSGDGGNEGLSVDNNGKVTVHSTMRIVGGNPANGRVLMTDDLGNASWQSLGNIPRTVATKTTGTSTYSNDDNWQNLTSWTGNLAASPNFFYKIDASMTVRLTGGDGTDDFEFRVLYESCGSTGHSEIQGYTPDQNHDNHNNFSMIRYLDYVDPNCSSGTIRFILQARNTGNDQWEARDRVLIVNTF